MKTTRSNEAEKVCIVFFLGKIKCYYVAIYISSSKLQKIIISEYFVLHNQ